MRNTLLTILTCLIAMIGHAQENPAYRIFTGEGENVDYGTYEFIRYQDSLAYWLDDGVDIDSVDTEKLEELEEKKNNLLDELAREFRNAGVDVTINETKLTPA